MYYNKVEICGINTSKLRTLSDEEKKELLDRLKNGDMAARMELIDGNLRLVLSIIQRFSNRGENLDDLFQVGCIGLIKAVDNFNTDLDVKFSTYAVPMIIGEVRRYLRDNNSIRVSRSMRDIAYKALQARDFLAKANANEPSIDEIAARLAQTGENHSREEIAQALEAIIEPISLFEPVYSDSSSSDTVYIMDQISDLSCCDEALLEDISLSEALRKLGERERRIIDMRFFKGKTQTEIAEEIGISQAQVSRLEKNALERMKKQFI